MEEPESELLDPIPAMIFWNVSQVSKNKPRRESPVQIMEQKKNKAFNIPWFRGKQWRQ